MVYRWYDQQRANRAEFAVKLDFLKKDRAYQMTSFEDGINAGRQAMDYRCKKVFTSEKWRCADCVKW